MKSYSEFLNENVYTSGKHPILRLVKLYLRRNPNGNFKGFWSQYGYNDDQARRIAFEEFYGMKNTRGQNVSAQDLWR